MLCVFSCDVVLSRVDIVFFISLVPSEQPRNFTIVTVSSTTVMLRWRSIREEARNAPITSYSISCNSSHPTHHVDPNPLLEDPDNEEAEYAVNITDLLPYTMYQCKLYANNSGGAGPVVMAGVRTFEDSELCDT